MKVYLGNDSPHDRGVSIPGPTVSVSGIDDVLQEDGTYTAGYVAGSDAIGVKRHLSENTGPVTHLPGMGAAVSIIRSWDDHGQSPPTWVKVVAEQRNHGDAKDFERFLSEYWDCPQGFPEDLEATHYTDQGAPGVGGQ